MLLSEVALGDMYEIGQAEFMTTAKGKSHSTKGCGIRVPDPADKTIMYAYVLFGRVCVCVCFSVVLWSLFSHRALCFQARALFSWLSKAY